MEQVIGISLGALERCIERVLRRVLRADCRCAACSATGADADEAATATLDQKKWWSNEELQRYMGVSAPTTQRWRSSGLLPYRKVGGVVMHRREDVFRMIEEARCEG